MGKFIYILAVALVILQTHSLKAHAAPLKVITQDDPVETCFKGTRERVISLVDQAINLVAEIGPRDAFRQFMAPEGGYISGDLYIFVLNPAGTILANGANPNSVGSNALFAQDKHGNYFVKNMILRAFSEGDGWTNYEMISPCTGRIAKKSSYCRRIDEFVVCMGLYEAAGRASRKPFAVHDRIVSS